MMRVSNTRNSCRSVASLLISSFWILSTIQCFWSSSSSSSMLQVVDARAILGVDLGSSYMKVALVQSGSPLEIVTNLHSKRKTEQMVLFEPRQQMQRFYGADANALYARKSLQTPTSFSVLLGRSDDHPAVKVISERHNPIKPIFNETLRSITLAVDKDHSFTPEELVAMVLTHAVDISVAHAIEKGADEKMAPPKDIVMTIPSFATQMERLALLDAAELAHLNVLTLVDENTAAAVQYAMDKQFTDGEQLFLFYNMGASSTQVSLVRFFSYDQPQKYGKPKQVPAVEVLAKAWDETLGGNAFDQLLVELLADQFNQEWAKSGKNAEKKDVRTIPRAMTKLRLQANKVKHVLSANTEIPVYMDAVHDDVSLVTHVSRIQFEELAATLLERAIAPAHRVLEMANKTFADLTEMELIGGGMRIPRIQAELAQAAGMNSPTAGAQTVAGAAEGKKSLGLHLNADEAMALGAAFCGANISTAFRVRHVGLTDVSPFTMSVKLQDLEVDKPAKKGWGKAKAAAAEEEEEVWTKQAVIFKAFGKLGIKKTIAFTHDKDVHCELDYVEDEHLPKGTEPSIARYNITGVAEFAEEMNKKELGRPKVSLQFELSASGITQLVKAEAAVDETYMVDEEIEVDDDGEGNATADANATTTAEGGGAKATAAETGATEERKAEETKDDEAAAAGKDGNATAGASEKNETGKNATAAVKPKKKKITIQKEMKRTHRKALKVETYYVGRVQPHTPELMAVSKQKLLDMAKQDKERVMLEESKNRVESYIYKIKNKLEDDAESLAKVSTEEQLEVVRQLAVDAEEWLDDAGYNADYPTMEDKYAEISAPFEKILLRLSEITDRPAAIEALQKKLIDVEQLLVKWETTMPQITEEDRTGVVEKVEEVRKWIADKEEAQAKLQPHEDPAFLSGEVPLQSFPVETLLVRLSRKPKPKPPKNATKTGNATKANATKTEEFSLNGTETTTASENATSEETADASGEEKNATEAKTEEAAADADAEAKTEEVADAGAAAGEGSESEVAEDEL